MVNTLGLRDTIRVVEEEKEVTKVIVGKEVTKKKLWKCFELSDYKCLSFTKIKEAISEIPRALIDLDITKDDVFKAYAQTRCVAPAWSAGTYCHCLGEEGLPHLTSPILSAHSRTPSFFQLFSNISFPSPMVKRTKPFLTLEHYLKTNISLLRPLPLHIQLQIGQVRQLSQLYILTNLSDT